MNTKICDCCGKIVWKSDVQCVCGRLYDEIVEKPIDYKGAYERYMNGDYEKASDEEVEIYLSNWASKYNIPWE